jgi:hypothetical protein
MRKRFKKLRRRLWDRLCLVRDGYYLLSRRRKGRIGRYWVWVNSSLFYHQLSPPWVSRWDDGFTGF